MKKLLIALSLCSAYTGAAVAQYNYSSASRLDSIENALSSANARVAVIKADSIHSSIWAKGTSFNIGYSSQSTSTDIYQRQDAQFGLFIDFNHSYLFPKKKAWGNVVKIGLNVRWLDVDFAKYGAFARAIQPKGASSDNYNGWVTAMENKKPSEGQDPNYTKFNQMTILAGMFGIGPTVTVAPFSFMQNAASPLTINFYFHYQPTLGVNMYQVQNVYAPQGSDPIAGEAKGDKQLCFELGYVSLMDLGFRIKWRFIGIGVEGRWGSGKLKNTTYTPTINTPSYFAGTPILVNGTSEKNYTRKFGETRVYLDFAF